MLMIEKTGKGCYEACMASKYFCKENVLKTPVFFVRASTFYALISLTSPMTDQEIDGSVSSY